MLHIAGKSSFSSYQSRYVYFNRFGYHSSYLYVRQMECAIGSFKTSYNGTSYGMQMDCTPFSNSNFRNYYSGILYCRQFTGAKTQDLIFVDNYPSVASSVPISSCSSSVSSTLETSTIATLCGSTTSSISNMLHSLVNC